MGAGFTVGGNKGPAAHRKGTGSSVSIRQPQTKSVGSHFWRVELREVRLQGGGGKRNKKAGAQTKLDEQSSQTPQGDRQRDTKRPSLLASEVMGGVRTLKIWKKGGEGF